jgi:hypothetical protein
VTNNENSGVITATPSSEKRGIRSTVRKATKEESEEDRAAKNRCGRCRWKELLVLMTQNEEEEKESMR